MPAPSFTSWLMQLVSVIAIVRLLIARAFSSDCAHGFNMSRQNAVDWLLPV
jgi:hypothetical protein